MLSHPSCLTDSKKERSIRCLCQGLELGVGLHFSRLGGVYNITLAFVALSPPPHPSLPLLTAWAAAINKSISSRLNALD